MEGWGEVPNVIHFGRDGIGEKERLLTKSGIEKTIHDIADVCKSAEPERFLDVVSKIVIAITTTDEDCGGRGHVGYRYAWQNRDDSLDQRFALAPRQTPPDTHPGLRPTPSLGQTRWRVFK